MVAPGHLHFPRGERSPESHGRQSPERQGERRLLIACDNPGGAAYFSELVRRLGLKTTVTVVSLPPQPAEDFLREALGVSDQAPACQRLFGVVSRSSWPAGGEDPLFLSGRHRSPAGRSVVARLLGNLPGFDFWLWLHLTPPAGATEGTATQEEEKWKKNLKAALPRQANEERWRTLFEPEMAPLRLAIARARERYPLSERKKGTECHELANLLLKTAGTHK
ncbi:MAG: hypothetical protein HQL57_09175 [Magnetococcales bacterium]|nr:hypothetical protein [Magnetococcales bacterium]MBF0157339.1 hypothetical protein [Magnetococcales bacterium]